MRHLLILLVELTCGLCAACESAEARAASEVHVNVEGNLQLLPFETAADFSQLKVAVVDPGALIANPDAAPLAVADVDATQCVGANLCPFFVAHVPISGTHGAGLALQVIDQRASGSQVWPPLYSGIAQDSTVDAAVRSQTDIGGCMAVVATRAGFGKLAAGTGQNADALIARGAMAGLVLGRASDATMESQGVPPPIAGVKLTAAEDRDVTIVYPNDDLSASASATGSLGLFLMTANKPQVVLTSLSLVAAPGDARTWKSVVDQSVGSMPNHLVFLVFQADN